MQPATWQPHSIFEAEAFWQKFCRLCDREVSVNEHGDQCPLLGGCSLGIYPKEFTMSEDGRKICTAFTPIKRKHDAAQERCTMTKDMFSTRDKDNPQ